MSKEQAAGVQGGNVGESGAARSVRVAGVRVAGVHVAGASAVVCALMFFLIASMWHVGGVLLYALPVFIVAVAGVAAWLFPAELYTPTPHASRIAAVAMSLAGVIAALIAAEQHFGAALFMLMSALIAGGFLFEMLRKERTQLIESLANIILMGTLGLASSGWMVARFARAAGLAISTTAFVAIIAFIVIGILCISLSVGAWSRDAVRASQAGGSGVKAPQAGEQSSDGKANEASQQTEEARNLSVSPVWRYAGLAAMLSGILPLMIFLISFIV